MFKLQIHKPLCSVKGYLNNSKSYLISGVRKKKRKEKEKCRILIVTGIGILVKKWYKQHVIHI